MPEFVEELRTYLVGIAGVQTEFGATDTRIYYVRRDESIEAAYPFAIYKAVTEAPTNAHDGPMPGGGLYQFDIYSDDPAQVISGEAAILAALSGFQGTMGSTAVGKCLALNARDDFDPVARLYVRSRDYSIGLTG